MNIQILATILAIGIGVTVFLTRNLMKKTARKPIWIETREITYKRRSRNTLL
jgi:hypothetical protein